MIYQRLAERERQGTPFQIGVIGAGTFGTQIIAQTCRMKGMRVAAICELSPDRAAAALAKGGISTGQIREAATAADVDRAIDAAQPAITKSLDALLESRIDLVI